MAAKASRKSISAPAQSAMTKKIVDLEQLVAKHYSRIRELESHLDDLARRHESLDHKLGRKSIMLDDAQRTIKTLALTIADARQAEIDSVAARLCDRAMADIPF